MVATLTQTIISPTLTVASVQAGFQTAMANAGFSSYSVYSTYYQTFYYQYNSAATKGTAYLNIAFTSSGQYIQPILYDSWNNTTNTGTNPQYITSSQWAMLNYNSTAITLTAINHPEFRGVVIVQGSYSSIIGILRPANIPTWWNENNYLYAFSANAYGNSNNAKGFGEYYACGSNPFNTTNSNYCNYWVYSGSFINSNPNNSNQYEIVTGLILGQPSGGGYLSGSAGTTSTDICFGAAYNKNLLDVWSIGSQQYTLLSAPVSFGGIGFGIRTA